MTTAWIPYRIIIVDDGSTDYTPVFLKEVAKENPAVKITTHPENRGFAKAVNSGLAESTADYVCLLNNDTKCWHGWMDEMYKVADEKAAGAVMATFDSWCGRHSVYLNNGIDETESVDYLTMTCTLLTRDAIQRVGLLDVELDPVFHSGQSDLDYGLRLKDAGFEIMVARKAFVHHAENKTLKSLECYKDGTYQLENYTELNGLRKKWGDDRIDQLVKDFWK